MQACAECPPATCPGIHDPKPDMTKPTDPYHAHVYFDADSLSVAQRLHQELVATLANGSLPGLVLVGKMYDKGVGPHPKPQFDFPTGRMRIGAARSRRSSFARRS